jgi:hypothetical protein
LLVEQLLEGQVAVVEGVEEFDWGVEGDGHADAFVGPEGEDLEDEYLGEVLGDFDGEGAVDAAAGTDGAGEEVVGVDVLEDDGVAEADGALLVAGWGGRYFWMWRLNWSSSDLARALRILTLGVSSLLISRILRSSSLISKLAAGMIWKMALR